MKALVLIDKTTGNISGYVQLATDSDAQFYPGAVEIPPDHPAIHEQENWKMVNGQLTRNK